MLLTQTVRLKLTKPEKDMLSDLCHLSKNLFNVGLYTVRQYFFQENKYLSYESNYHLCKENENYQLLATDCGQQTLKYVDRCFKAFFRLLSMRKEGTYRERVNLPRYLPKDGYFPLIIPIRKRHDFVKDDWKFKIPTSRKYAREHGSVYITVPPNIRDYQIKEIRILPRQKGKFLEAAFIYESSNEQVNFVNDEAISIDLGLNNLATVVSSTNESFIIDGRWLKSINQWFNKRRAKLVHHKDKQGIKHLTKQEAWLSYRRKNQVNDYLNKAARYIINFCISRKIGTIVVGYNPTLKQETQLGKRNNQNFVQIPIFTLRAKLESLCERYGLNYVEQEESYTSKASSLDHDEIPVYNADNPVNPSFSGRRVKRGLYKTKNGHLINADANGSLGIGLKSSYKEIFLRVGRVCLTQPVRVNVLQKSPITASA
ncbi:transposase, IS607 family [Gloeothece citriformis PCC 7424]|uniref:Transposase, IS607 family n=1 Tax=Gloeothece citriformis (strain PCC 7424) TaxID=65393 RepID=B7K976_GLOC7|nr:RNA-guided endonuclease TnpB family protein [Gloeothece citriformis]ACK68559.1 transposase, IS607 family [Gloeothece citriformis PCC 7424]